MFKTSLPPPVLYFFFVNVSSFPPVNVSSIRSTRRPGFSTALKSLRRVQHMPDLHDAGTPSITAFVYLTTRRTPGRALLHKSYFRLSVIPRLDLTPGCFTSDSSSAPQTPGERSTPISVLFPTAVTSHPGGPTRILRNAGPEQQKHDSRYIRGARWVSRPIGAAFNGTFCKEKLLDEASQTMATGKKTTTKKQQLKRQLVGEGRGAEELPAERRRLQRAAAA